jgi:hypothetical protein
MSEETPEVETAGEIETAGEVETAGEPVGDGSLKGEIVGDFHLARSTMVEALLAERAGYARRGLADRVAQVDEQLAYHGYQEPPQGGEVPVKARGQRTAKG